MIDINLIRKDETRDKVIKSELKRGRDKNKVIQVYELDIKVIKLRSEKEQLKKQSNFLQKEMANLKKNNKEEDFTAKLKERNTLENKIEVMEKEIKELEINLLAYLNEIGNVLDDEVVFSLTEEDNKLIREYQTDRKVLANLPYDMIFKKVEGVDLERGTKLAGHRGFILKEEIALLKTALSNYAVAFARERKYLLVQPPVLMKKEIIAKTAQLSDFDDQLYSVGDEYYLIATSEQPISMMFEDERFNPQDLPLKYIGESLCFRKEAGAHGKDNRGIFRVHQFDKIEQFVICAPEESKFYFQEMVKTAEEFYQSLKISYKLISIVSGAMNDAAAIKYDLEALFPHKDRYRELVSVSNCTDYQSRSGEIRFGKGKIKGEKMYVHMLNGTLCAVQRTLCCLVENYQTNDGIVVPEVLRKYYGADFIPFKN
ncbi:Seryl-tRNA synthetase [Tubulinosema ratisbonensis]|uniref:serine--tRNA ligase n=1 Tax=Tubulinosema ratisbonensis TaxID=291195 RepID=A0A437AII4_9MICR|nr:Seryl-tRNA synthetase [Tubulinosema ratisbonensis]